MSNPRSIGTIINSVLPNIIAGAVPILKRHRKLVSEMFSEPLDYKLTHADALRCMFIPQNETELLIHDKIMNTPDLPNRIIDTSNNSDFRSLLRDLLHAESNNIRDCLYEVRKEDPNEYLKRINDIARIALPKENNVKVDVDIKERQDITLRMQEMYRFSSYATPATVPDASAPGLDASSQVGDTFGAVETDYEEVVKPENVKAPKTKSSNKRNTKKQK